jgi:bacterioferritin
MRGDERVIQALNEALQAELTAINQYIVHAEMCENWGYDRLHALIQKSAIDEMRHAEKLIARILFLDGTPHVGVLGTVRIGNTVKEQFENDLAGEREAVTNYNQSVKLCTEVGDNGSRELFEQLLVDEEGHVDWLEAQLHDIAEIGYSAYLAEQMRKE